jgi:hypothetical protein
MFHEKGLSDGCIRTDPLNRPPVGKPNERSMMSEMKDQTPAKGAQPSAAPIFVPKSDNTIALSLDESINLIKQEQAKKAAIEKKIDNLKEVAKAHMKTMDVETYTTPTGIKAWWSSRQDLHIDKEKAKEICGPRWAEVESFKTVRSFTVK